VRPGFVATAGNAKAAHARPFVWPVDRAARYIVRRLPSEPAVIAFPWPLVWATRFAHLLPPWLYDRAMRAASPTSA
jgi:hypothetical protein